MEKAQDRRFGFLNTFMYNTYKAKESKMEEEFEPEWCDRCGETVQWFDGLCEECLYE